MAYEVVCLGIVVADVITKQVDRLPEEGKLELVDQIGIYTGGCAANTAVDLSKLGVNTAIIAKMGKDGFGDFLINDIKSQQVDVSGVKMVEGINTSSSVVIVNSKGERSFLHCLGSNAYFEQQDIDFSIIEQSKILFVAGALLMPKFDGKPTAEILKKAQEKGVYTALDTAWDSKGNWLKHIGECLPYLDLFIPSREEAELISSKTDVEQMADVFLGYGTKLVVIKLGKDGCFIKSADGQKYTIATFNDVERVDTTGAGDSFVAGFLTGVLKGWDLAKCGKFANAVGTHCIMEMGATTGIKSFQETLDFLESNG